MELSENKMGVMPIRQLIIHMSWPMMLTFLLALHLLLSGCTSPKNLPTPSPADAGGPAPAVSASDSPIPSPTPEVLWREGMTAGNLPTEVEPVGNISSVDGPVCLALLPDADIGLYGDGDPTAGILLRKGNYLQFFPQTYATARYTEPELNWTDKDGDKNSELIIKYLIMTVMTFYLRITIWRA